MDRARTTRRRNASTTRSNSSTPWILSAKAVTALKSPGAVWSVRSDALQALVDCTKCVDDNDSARDKLAAQVRTLAPALAKIVADLRSALVRQSCEAIIHLAQTLGSRFTEAASDEVLPALLRRAGTKKLIMRESAANAATTMLNLGGEGVPRSVALHLCAAILDKTSPAPVRAAAATYKGILLRNSCPSLFALGKELNNSIRAGCSDADEPVRAASRENLRSLRSSDEERYSAIYELLSKKVQDLVDDERFMATPKTEEKGVRHMPQTNRSPVLPPPAESSRVQVNKRLPRPPAERTTSKPIKAEVSDDVVTTAPVRASLPVRSSAPIIVANVVTRPSYMPRVYVPRRRETLVRRLQEKDQDVEGDENSKENAENSNKPMYPRRSAITGLDKSLPRKTAPQDVLKRLDNRPHPQKRASFMVPNRLERANVEKPSEIIARRPTTIPKPALKPANERRPPPAPLQVQKPTAKPLLVRKNVPAPNHVTSEVTAPKRAPLPIPVVKREATKPPVDRTRRPTVARPPTGAGAAKTKAKSAVKPLPKPRENTSKPVVSVRKTVTPATSRPWNLPPPPAAIAKPRHMRQSTLPISKRRTENKDSRRTLRSKQVKATATRGVVRHRHTTVGTKPPVLKKHLSKSRPGVRASVGATKPMNLGSKKPISAKVVTTRATKKPTPALPKPKPATAVCCNKNQKQPVENAFEPVIDDEPIRQKSSSHSFLRLSDFGASSDIIQDSSEVAVAVTGDSTDCVPPPTRKREVTFAKTSNSSTHCSREARERSASLSSYGGSTSTSRVLATISANTVTPKADAKTRISFLLGDDRAPKLPISDESDTVSETAETSQVRFRFHQQEDSMPGQGACKSPSSFASAVSTSRKRTSNKKETAPLRRITDFKPRRAVQVDSIE